MKRTLLIVMLVFVLLNLKGQDLAHAQTGGGYDLTWHTIGAGGGTSAGGGYTLMGTIGQLDAGAAMRGGGFTLVGGFWGAGGPASEPARYPIYLPVVMRP